MDWDSLSKLFEGFTGIGDDPRLLAMIAIGCVLLYLGIKRNFEPLLLVGIGSGIILANLPIGEIIKVPHGEEVGGVLYYFHEYLLRTEIIPLLIFLGLGALTDFTPVLNYPYTLLLGAAAQLGVFVALTGAVALGFGLTEAASIGIIGGADGPTTIYVATKMQEIGGKNILGPVAVAAYSYMALVPVLQPPVIRLLTTRKERLVRMDYCPAARSQAGQDPAPHHHDHRGWPASPSCSALDRHVRLRQPPARVPGGGAAVKRGTERADEHRHHHPGHHRRVHHDGGGFP